ncbi:hypothetical protein ARALYDRAFT_896967 [Arabidopsis lyrata subsp. lyrata]|uniref:DNA topoisomerase (ATP-hydrolyzing) n=1 Tax=Arabidopsis lyrata subsp. lyrata TaxID=81972 RepID=D7L732_ARALL|nr:hypothetical protein ARALYDRAFT_896967 [Arabidopsis lyrata subsp. lyrata]
MGSMFMPIIPTILVNGSQGIGAGWNNFIPNYNPMVPMDPWYRGFRGTIEKTASNEHGAIRMWTNDYKKILVFNEDRSWPPLYPSRNACFYQKL